MKNDIVIVSAVRTPFSKFGGSLKKIHSSDLGVVVIKEALKRAGLKGSDIDEFYYGMCIQSEAALLYNVIARQALLKAGLPADVVSLTIDRACCSSLIAVQLGCKSMMAGDANICMVGGAENMSNTPVVLNGHRWGTGLKPMTMVDHLNPIMYVGFNSLALDAGNVALEHGIGRLIQDEWAQIKQIQ
jgi:acetyl-CoA C-acetyltransferase